MSSSTGGALTGFGSLFWTVCGLIAFIVNFFRVINAWGLLGGILAFMLFPVVIVAAPWYALIALDNPIPLIITYGGGLIGIIIMTVGVVISGDD